MVVNIVVERVPGKATTLMLHRYISRGIGILNNLPDNTGNVVLRALLQGLAL